jgi:hypothetical protein
VIHYRDFVPEMVEPPGFFSPAEHESFDAAVADANLWIAENRIKVLSVETVVLPNIWSRFEKGTSDGALGTSGEQPSHWHQFVRIWYQG